MDIQDGKEEGRMKKKWYELTNAQKRIWYTQKLYQGSSMFNIGGRVVIHGNLNIEKLADAIKYVTSMNDSFSIKFKEEREKVSLCYNEECSGKVDVIDFSQEGNKETDFESWYQKESITPLNIEQNELFYFAAYKIREDLCGYFIKIHHIIADGWSIQLLTDQVGGIYSQIMKGESPDYEIPPSYREFSEKEQEYLASPQKEKNKKFWMNKLSNLPDVISKNSYEIDGKRKTFYLNKSDTQRIRYFCKKQGESLNTFFITMYLLYQYRTTGQTDLIVGTPLLGRRNRRDMSTIGMFVNTVVLRFQISEEQTAVQMMKKILGEFKYCYANQCYPYNYILEDLADEPQGIVSLYNTCINYYNTTIPTEIDGMSAENFEFYNGQQEYAFQLIIRDWTEGNELQLDFDYKTSEYTSLDIQNMYDGIGSIINAILAEPTIQVKDINILGEAKQENIIYQFNKTKTEYSSNKTVIDLFQEQVKKCPDTVAISMGHQTMTYEELDQKSSQIAAILIQKKLLRNSVIALLLTHSVETVSCILGILKAGCTYLPIDTDYPVERVNFMLQDADVCMVLTNTNRSLHEDRNYEVLHVDHFDYDSNELKIEYVRKPADLAYIIYTSGSTGQPKGTMIRHRELINYIYWAGKTYVTADREVFPLYTSIAFDLTVTSIFVPLTTGMEIRVYENNEYKNALFQIVEENRCTIVKLTPSHLALLSEYDFCGCSIKKLILGGENLTTESARQIMRAFHDDIIIYNEYGPTEATIGCMIHHYDPQKDREGCVPIGRPIDNVMIYILNDYLKPVPIGVNGQICISGDCVSKGYLKQPAITAEKFIQNPFINSQTMYLTGDIGRFISESSIEYIGRVDDQVKIRGHRVELAEIKQCMLKIPQIKQTYIDFAILEGQQNLCAYYTTSMPVTLEEIKEQLMALLPSYMLPSYFIELDQMPLTLNGKIDKSKLTAITLLSEEQTLGADNSELNEQEQILLEVMSRVLNKTHITVHDDFFQLGGDSIKAIQISVQLMEMGYKLKSRDILIHTSVRSIAQKMEHENIMRVDQGVMTGEIPKNAITEWFFGLKLENENHYNQTIILSLKEKISTDLMTNVLRIIVQHHDSLRINYCRDRECLFYNEQHLTNELYIEEYDLTGKSEFEVSETVCHLRQNMKKSFDITKDLLIKGCMIRIDQCDQFILTAHHLIVDGISWKIIVEDIHKLMEYYLAGSEPKLPEKTSSYLSWTEALLKYHPADTVSYWEYILDVKSKSEMIQKPDAKAAESITVYRSLNKKETEQLTGEANRIYNTRMPELIISAVVRTIHKIYAQKHVVMQLEGHGRYEIFDQLDISRTVGWFTNIYPFMVQQVHDTLEECIVSVKEQLREIPNNGFDYGIYKYLRKAFKQSDNNLIRLNYMGDLSSLDYTYFNTSYDDTGNVDDRNVMDSLMDINCFIKDGIFQIMFVSQNKLGGEEVNHFAKIYIDNLLEILEFCYRQDQVTFTPSDFDTIQLSMEELDSLF